MGHCRQWDLLSFHQPCVQHVPPHPFITGSVLRMTCGGIRRHLWKYMAVVMISRGKWFQNSLSLCILMLKQQVEAFFSSNGIIADAHSEFLLLSRIFLAETFLQTIVLGMLAMHSHTFPPGVGMISRVILLGMLEKHSHFHSPRENIFHQMNPLMKLWVHSHVCPPGGSIVPTEGHIWDACGDAEDSVSRSSTRWRHLSTTRFYW